MMQRSLAGKLRRLRAKHGYTLVEAAAKTGVDRGTLSSLERGAHTPYTPTLAKIARGYEIPVEELLEEEIFPAGDPSEGAPQIRREAFVEHGVEPSDAEVETLNYLLKALTRVARTGEKVDIVYDRPVDIERVYLLVDFAIASGILTPREVAIIRDGARAQLVAGES